MHSSSLLLALASAAVVAGCSAPPSHLDPGPQKDGWRDTGTPVRPLTVDQLARYYVDEDGALWDDHGRKYEGTP